MESVSDWIRASARDQHIVITELSHSEASSLRARIEGKFATTGNGKPLWERLQAGLARQAPDGWRRIGTALGARTSFVFTDPDDDAAVFRISSGPDLLRILEDTPQFDLYVVDVTESFLVCFNDHDFLLAAGEVPGEIQQLFETV